MNSFFGGKKEPALRPMKRSDISKVIEIINDHDEDDAEEALESFQESLEGMFVLEEPRGFSLEANSGVFGVIGAYEDPNAPDVCWLSWTYVAEDRQGQGWGRMMMESLLQMLQESGVRKLFIATSDYEEDGEQIYADAIKLYKSMGAELELTVPEYHDRNESQLVFGLEVTQQLADRENPEPLEGQLEFEDVNAVSESDRGYALNWIVHEEEVELPAVRDQLEKYEKEGREHKARILLTRLPTDLSSTVEEDLKAYNFKNVGRLKDFYEVGLHEEYWLKIF